MTPTRVPHRRLRRVLIILIILATLIGAAILFGPTLLLRVLNFVPRGNVETFWQQLEQESTAELQPLPAILSTRHPTRVVNAGTETPSPTVVTPTAPPTLTPVPALGNPPLTGVSATPTVSDTPAPTPTMTPTNPYADWFSVALQPDQVQILARGYLALNLDGSKTFADVLWVGRDTDNQPFGIAQFDENAIPGLCAEYFNTCRDPRFRIDKVDFRPNGMVIYGSVNVLNLYWQQVGVALLLDTNKTHLKLAGMVWNDELYEVPTTGPLVTALKDLADRGNAALDLLNVYALGYDLTVAELYFDDNRFIVVLKSAAPS